MATVPVTDNNVTPMMPDALRPRPMDFMMAAAVLHQQGRLQMPGEMPGGTQLAGISRRQQDSWQRRLENAESDDDIKALRDSMKRKGVDPDSYPPLQLDPQKGSQLEGRQQMAANFAQRFSGEQDRLPTPKGTTPLTVGKAQDLVYRTRKFKRGGAVVIPEDQLVRE